MPSENKTPNIGLNQWEGNEYPKREDFNTDNALVDGKVGDLEQGILDALNRANEAFQSASDGKVLLSGAITGKGVPTAPDDTFSKMATNINAIETDPSIGTTDATAADLRQGKSAISQGKRIVGTIPSKGAATIIPTITEQRILAGQYLSGDQIIQAVNVPADKVLAGTTIAGRAGTMPNRTNTDTGGSYPLAVASSYVPGIVHLMPPAGYYNGGVWVKIPEPDLQPGNILAGKKIGNGSGGVVTGSIPNRGAPATTLTTQGGRYNIPAGYFSGGYVMAQFANLTPGNVKAGVPIGGVVGSLIEFPILPNGIGILHDSGTISVPRSTTRSITKPNSLCFVIINTDSSHYHWVFIVRGSNYWGFYINTHASGEITQISTPISRISSSREGVSGIGDTSITLIGDNSEDTTMRYRIYKIQQ